MSGPTTLIDPSTIPPSYWLKTLSGWWDSSTIQQSLYSATFQDMFSTAQVSGTSGQTWSTTDSETFGPEEVYDSIGIYTQATYLKRYIFTGPNVVGSPLLYGGWGGTPPICYYYPTGPIVGLKAYLAPNGYYCGLDYAYNTCACTSQLFLLSDYSLKTINQSFGNPPVNQAWNIFSSLDNTSFLNTSCGDFLLSPVLTPVNGYSPVDPVNAGFITSTPGNASSITVTVTDVTISGTFNVLLQVTNRSGYSIASDPTVYTATPLYFYVKLVIVCVPSYTLATQPESPFDYTLFPVSSMATTPTAISFVDSVGCNIPITYSCQYLGAACPSWIGINSSNQMTVNTSNIANIGAKTITINGTYGPLVNGLTYSVPSTSWALRVNQCIPSFTLTTQPEGSSSNPFTFTLYEDTSLTTTAAILFTDSIGCGIVPTFSCQLSGAACPSWVGLNGSKKMNVNLPSNPGTYVITIRGQYVSQLGAIVALPDTLWYLQIVDPCATTTFLPVTLPDHKTIVGLASQIKYQEFQNSYGPICGSQTATVTLLDPWQSWTTTGSHAANTMTFTLGINASGQTQGQILTKTIQVKLDNYPLVSATFQQKIVMYSVSLSQIPDLTYMSQSPTLPIPFSVAWLPEPPPSSDSNYLLTFSGLVKTYNGQVPPSQTLPNSPEFSILVENELVKIENTAARNSGDYKILYQVQLKTYPVLSPVNLTFNLNILKPLPPDASIGNRLPTFVTPNDWPTQVTLGCGQAWVQKVPDCEVESNEVCSQYIDLGPAKVFAKQDSVQKLIYVEKDVVTKDLQGVYPIKVILNDGVGEAIQNLDITVACNPVNQLTKSVGEQQKVAAGSVVPYIQRINNIGQVFISFSQPVVPVNITNITYGTFKANNVTWPALAIKMIPDDQEKTIDFSWECTNFTSTSLELQLNFTRPNWVSYSSPRDQIQITFWGQNYFIANSSSNDTRRLSTPQYVEFGFNLTHYIPPQAELSQQQTIAAVGKVISDAGQGVEIGSLLLNIVMSGSLAHLLCQIKKVQIVVHQILVNLPIPANAQIFFGFLLPIVAFDIIPTQDFYDGVLGHQEEVAITENFNALGYSSKYFLRNLGSIGIYFAIYPVVLLISFLIGRFCKYKKVLELKRKLDRIVYWNTWFELVEESYLILVVSTMLNLRCYSSDDFQSFGGAINFLAAVLCAPAVLVHLGLVSFILIRRFDLIRRRHPSTDKYKQIFKPLKIRLNHQNETPALSGKHTISHPIWSLIRRVILGVTVVCMTASPVFCLFTMNFTTLTSIIIVGTQEPFADKVMKSMDLFNEFVVLLINYHLMCCTNFLSDPNMREYVGWSMIVVTCLFMAINIAFALVRMGHKPCTRVRYEYLRMKAIRRRNLNRDKKVVVVEKKKWILIEKLGLDYAMYAKAREDASQQAREEASKDMYARAREISSKLTLTFENDQASQPRAQDVEETKNDVQLEDVEGPQSGLAPSSLYKSKRSEFVEPPSMQEQRSQYFVKPLAIKQEHLIDAKTKKVSLQQYLQNVVGVAPEEEPKQMSFQIDDVPDLEMQPRRLLTKPKPYYTPERSVALENHRTRLSQLNKDFLVTKKF